MRVYARRVTRFTAGVALVLAGPAIAVAQDGGAVELPGWVINLALYLPALLLGIGLHEWAHATTAWRLGDSTPQEQGRLSLNPLDHLDPWGTLLIMVACVTGLPIIGWGKAVEVRPSAFRNPIKDMTKVAAAGPLMNVVQGSAALVLLTALLRFGALPAHEAAWGKNLFQLLANIVYVNFSLAVFNMIPIPPLDGSKVLVSFVTADVVLFMRKIEPIGIILIYMLMSQGILDLPFQVMFDIVGMALGNLWVTVTLAALVAVGTQLFVGSLEDD